MERLRAVPGVQRVGIVENLPLQEGYAIARGVSEADVEQEGPEAAGRVLGLTVAAGDSFDAMGIEVLRGRAFTEAEPIENPGHVIVSRAAAEQFWPGEDPIGKRVRTTTREPWETVIGAVEEVMPYDFRRASEPLMYYPLVSQNPADCTIGSPAYVVETPRADGIGEEIRALVREVDPRAPIYRVFTMEELARASTSRLTLTLLALGGAPGLSLLLGTVGLYGVLSAVVAERTREIGVRMALGADARRLRRMVVGRGLRVVGIGVALGLGAAVLATRALETLLFGADAADPWTLAGTAALMLLVGVVASWIPARRASSVDPVESLAVGWSPAPAGTRPRGSGADPRSPSPSRNRQRLARIGAHPLLVEGVVEGRHPVGDQRVQPLDHPRGLLPRALDLPELVLGGGRRRRRGAPRWPPAPPGSPRARP